MSWKPQITACAIVLTSAAQVCAATSEPWGGGGVTAKFVPIVQRYNQSGELFRIRGHCQSACTMFLAIRNVCIEPSATLLFHAAKFPDSTRRMFNSYNARLKSYLTANRAMESRTFHTISGRDMINKLGYRACPSG